VFPLLRNKIFQQALNEEDKHKLQAAERKIRAEANNEVRTVNPLDKINNYNLLIEIKDTFINLVPYSNMTLPYSNIVFDKTSELTNNIIYNKNMIIKGVNGKTTKVLQALNVTDICVIYDSQAIDLVYSKIQPLVNKVKKIIDEYKTSEAQLCNAIINKMTNNICVFNFIRHLANLGFLASYTIETSLEIKLSNDTYKELYKQLHTNYPYNLARFIKAAKTDYINSIISSFDRNLNVINDTNVYTNCENNKESEPKTQKKNKYLKYKFKYLKLKNQMGG
jgi:hypothetical protein